MGVKSGYKNTEVGIVPNDWAVKAIDKEIDLITGFPFPSSGYSEAGIRLLRGSNVKRGSTDWSEGITQYWEKLTPELKPYILNDGDIVIAMDGSLVGRSFARLSNADLPALLLQRVARIRSTKIDLGYLKEFICSDYFTKYCDTVKTSSAIPHISPKDIRGFSIPLPPTKAEQTAIATALSDADALINSLEKLIAKKRNIKQGAMQKLLKPKKGWEVKKLGEIFVFHNTANFSKAEMSFDGKIGCLHYGLIHAIPNVIYSLENGVKFYLKEDTTSYELIQDGDIVMVDASEDFLGINKCIEVSNVANRKLIAGLHTYLMRDANTSLVKNFRGLILNSNMIKQQLLRLAVGMKVYGVSKSQLKEVLIPIPPKEEQCQIAAILSDMDTEIKTLETKLEKYQKVKLGMMQNLLTGKIRLV